LERYISFDTIPNAECQYNSLGAINTERSLPYTDHTKEKKAGKDEQKKSM
jgi:hypothetical protein